MNSSCRLFIKAGISLAALLFVCGCKSSQDSASSPSSSIPDQKASIAYKGFVIEVIENKKNINVICKEESDTKLLLKQEGDNKKFIDANGGTIAILSYEQSGTEWELTSQGCLLQLEENGEKTVAFLYLNQ
ncbi:MAG: hypothetical protein LBQ18_00095 [Campylobacteraceae bacterium]|jgi:hypothetical protein|nr:hypothetical protein [Campylobacteraceae bacterium]